MERSKVIVLAVGLWARLTIANPHGEEVFAAVVADACAPLHIYSVMYLVIELIVPQTVLELMMEGQ